MDYATQRSFLTTIALRITNNPDQKINIWRSRLQEIVSTSEYPQVVLSRMHISDYVASSQLVLFLHFSYLANTTRAGIQPASRSTGTSFYHITYLLPIDGSSMLFRKFAAESLDIPLRSREAKKKGRSYVYSAAAFISTRSHQS